MQSIHSHVNDDLPLVLLGIKGPSYAGKNLLSRMIVPSASTTSIDEEKYSGKGHFFTWSSVPFTLPIKGLYRSLMSINGHYARDRKLYAVHSELSALFGNSPVAGAPPYDDLIELVHEVVDCKLDDSAKTQRDFMQWIGNRCRQLRSDCFVSSAKSQIIKDHYVKVSEWFYSRNEGDPVPTAHIVVIPDCRLWDEGEFIRNYPYSYIVDLDLDEFGVKQQALELDGMNLTPDQLKDLTETEVRQWPEEWIDHYVDISYVDNMNALAYDIVDMVTDYAKGLNRA